MVARTLVRERVGQTSPRQHAPGGSHWRGDGLHRPRRRAGPPAGRLAGPADEHRQLQPRPIHRGPRDRHQRRPPIDRQRPRLHGLHLPVLEQRRAARRPDRRSASTRRKYRPPPGRARWSDRRGRPSLSRTRISGRKGSTSAWSSAGSSVSHGRSLRQTDCSAIPADPIDSQAELYPATVSRQAPGRTGACGRPGL